MVSCGPGLSPGSADLASMLEGHLPASHLRVLIPGALEVPYPTPPCVGSQTLASCHPFSPKKTGGC